MNEYVQVTHVLKRVLGEHHHLDDSLEENQSPLVQQICYGACRHYFFYKEMMNLLLDRPLPDKHLDLQSLIIAGLYSIDHLHRPAHASVNNVVEATQKLKKPWARGLVNAVMRRYGREGEDLASSVTEAGRLNHPPWLINRLREDWPDHLEIFTANNTQAPMTLRLNTRRVKRDDYLGQLADDGIGAQAGVLSPHAVTLRQAMPVHDIPGFDEGLVSIQDEAPQLSADLMNLFDGAHVLDACAAPGGKTCHILESADDIRLTAVDRDARRIHRISDNLKRLSLTAEVVKSDLEDYTSPTPFDRILLDVPCSATGIIRRHPDIKLLRSLDDVGKLAGIQRGLLDKAFDLLGKDGELLYSTCSILRQENDEVIADFLAKAQNARINPIDAPSATSVVTTRYGLQLLPTVTTHDGFYYASISKVAE